MKEFYLDNASTTRVDERVLKEMQKYFLNDYGNPSSAHKLGEEARRDIDKAREIIAKEIGAKPWEIYFTSGGTESNNIALQGLARAFPFKKKIIISSIEHPSITEICNYLETQGYRIIKIPVDAQGHVRIDAIEREIDKDTLLVSVMHVNNVFGVVQDIEKIGQVCRNKETVFHTDAVQSFGKIGINVQSGIDMLSASGHKLNGPKGIGLLYVKEGIGIKPLVYGGGQEKGIRSGTENVPGIIGFAKALEMQKKVNRDKIRKVRDRFIEELQRIGGKINGSMQDRIYNNIHVSFTLVDSEVLVQWLSKKGIYVSAGSACDSKKGKEDESLKAIGLTQIESKGSIRITINEDIDEKDVKFIVKEIDKAVKKLKV
jgi:cysteine desulfurase